MVETWHHSRYETKPLEESLKQVFTDDEYLFGGRRRRSPGGTPLKVAITGMCY